MIQQSTHTNDAMLGLSIDQLQLTLETTRVLKAQGIERIGQLVERRAAGIAALRLQPVQAIEVRDVLASRGY